MAQNQLWIKGEPVSSGDIFKNGTALWDQATQTLTLNNFKSWDVSGLETADVIKTDATDFKLCIHGTCDLSTGGETACGILSPGNIKIYTDQDSAKLNIRSAFCGIRHDNFLHICGTMDNIIFVSMIPGKYGIRGPENAWEDGNPITNLDSCYLEISGAKEGAITNQIAFNTMGVVRTYPYPDDDVELSNTNLCLKEDKSIVTSVVYKRNVSAAALNDTNATGKPLKVMENGQVVIIRDGVRYNVLGAVIE